MAYVVSVMCLKFLYIIPVLLLLAGCTARTERKTKPAAAPSELALPVIPDSLADPADRAGWLVLHYWDGMDFGKTALSLDTAFMEQSFANYTTVLALVDAGQRSIAVERLMKRASVEPRAAAFLADIAERYLYDLESPVYNQDLFLPFVEYQLAAGGTDTGLEQLRADIMKNAPGTKAPDIVLTAPDGSLHHLFRDGSQAKILLLFYEPDCNVCHDMMERLRTDPALEKGIADDSLRLVAVYQGDDVGAWMEHASSLPPQWEVRHDARGIIDGDELFIVRATPTVYLLAPDGTVLSR